MGLSDLKKNNTQSNGVARAISLDEFIDAATRYAMGETTAQYSAALGDEVCNVIPLYGQTQAMIAPNTASELERPHYRRATFYLSESAISHLTQLAADTDMSKSKLIRALIEQHYALPLPLRRIPRPPR
ncbi:ribbon-helix-helix domain-containing protein [Shewanella sp.]|uniref:ribbon-helix-helix domain-containing protein n=1 Tax=Shewanella sp. TaxID=50422 RepID=UPI003F39841B